MGGVDGRDRHIIPAAIWSNNVKYAPPICILCNGYNADK